MNIAPHFLALAIVLLWLPTALFLGHRRRRELRKSDRESLVSIPALMASPWSWIDLVRAGGGAWLLLNPTFLPSTGPFRLRYFLIALSIQVVALFFGVWAQTMLTGSRRLRLAPLFYLLGVTVVLVPWQVSLFGGALGLTLTGMLGQWRGVFWIMPLTLGAAAALFRSINLYTALTPVLYLIPALLGVRPEKPLAWVFSRSRAKTIQMDDGSSGRHYRRSRPHDAPVRRAPIAVKYSETRGSFGSD